MNTIFKTYDTFLDEYMKCSGYECEECKNLCEVSIEPLKVTIENRVIRFKDIPLLKCIDCGLLYYTFYSKQMIDGVYKIMVKKRQCEGEHYYKGYREKFNYCIEQDFNYDHRDFYSIPGLCIDEEHSEKGFLTPVFFTKKALLSFMIDPDYSLELFSETYGYLKQGGVWGVPFGLNRNGKIVFWLGDLSIMDEVTLNTLKPHNIESDHQVIDSEFYAAQMCCVWSEPNRELKVCYKKIELFDALNKKYNISLHHLTNEVKEQMSGFQKPLIITERVIEPAINMLHKTLIEGVNINEFRKLYINIVSKPQRGYEGWKSIKLYEALLNEVITGDLDLRAIMSPLYLLNDLRQYFDHLLPMEKKEEIRNNIIQSFKVESFRNIEEIYECLINGLNILFEYLVLGYKDAEE